MADRSCVPGCASGPDSPIPRHPPALGHEFLFLRQWGRRMPDVRSGGPALFTIAQEPGQTFCSGTTAIPAAFARGVRLDLGEETYAEYDLTDYCHHSDRSAGGYSANNWNTKQWGWCSRDAWKQVRSSHQKFW
jgi:hypothetical protein